MLDFPVYIALAINIMDELGLSSKMHCEHLLKETKVISHHFIKGGVNNSPSLTRCSTSVIKVIGRVCSKAFKGRVGFRFTLRISRHGLTVVETNLLRWC